MNLATYIAPGAKLSGDITLEKNTSVWFNAVIRADVNQIHIGAYSNIQDLAMIHVSKNYPAIIGQYVTIGHHAIVHGCTLENHVLIGMGAIILDGAVIGENSIIGAGALVSENKIIPKNSLVVGVPGRIVRQVTEDEIKMIHENALAYLDNAIQYQNKTIKIW